MPSINLKQSWYLSVILRDRASSGPRRDIDGQRTSDVTTMTSAPLDGPTSAGTIVWTKLDVKRPRLLCLSCMCFGFDRLWSYYLVRNMQSSNRVKNSKQYDLLISFKKLKTKISHVKLTLLFKGHIMNTKIIYIAAPTVSHDLKSSLHSCPKNFFGYRILQIFWALKSQTRI